MKRALIGYTGFVGNNLCHQYKFDGLYNSKNFREMANQSYDVIVCAGISSVKWAANKEPEEDKKRIDDLRNVLCRIKCKTFLLISTIDVYPVTQGKNEAFQCDGLDNHPYGRHRLEFENFCRTQFSNCYIIRLPGLFGSGLKKNVIFDLLNDNNLEKINPNSTFQYYYLNNLWRDINKIAENGIHLINFFTEPLPTRLMIDQYFQNKVVGGNPDPEVHYDLRTSHAALWGKRGEYIYSQREILEQLGDFIKKYRAATP